MPARKTVDVVFELIDSKSVGRDAGHIRDRRRQRRINENGVPLIAPEIGEAVVIDVVGRERDTERLHVGMAARDFRPDLRVEKIGHCDGRQNPDNRDDDQKFDQRERVSRTFVRNEFVNHHGFHHLSVFFIIQSFQLSVVNFKIVG